MVVAVRTTPAGTKLLYRVDEGQLLWVLRSLGVEPWIVATLAPCIIRRSIVLTTAIVLPGIGLAEITEMIHTASLVHDDVVDEAELRRGVPTVNSLFDNRVAVLAGDFLFAQSSWYLANLDNLEVVKLLSEVIRDFAEGEIQQGINRFDTSISLAAYLEKSYYKTASLIANSAKAAGVLSEQSAEVNHHLYNYGRNLGLAFQIL